MGYTYQPQLGALAGFLKHKVCINSCKEAAGCAWSHIGPRCLAAVVSSHFWYEGRLSTWKVAAPEWWSDEAWAMLPGRAASVQLNAWMRGKGFDSPGFGIEDGWLAMLFGGTPGLLTRAQVRMLVHEGYRHTTLAEVHAIAVNAGWAIQTIPDHCRSTGAAQCAAVGFLRAGDCAGAHARRVAFRCHPGRHSEAVQCAGGSDCRRASTDSEVRPVRQRRCARTPVAIASCARGRAGGNIPPRERRCHWRLGPERVPWTNLLSYMWALWTQKKRLWKMSFLCKEVMFVASIRSFSEVFCCFGIYLISHYKDTPVITNQLEQNCM